MCNSLLGDNPVDTLRKKNSINRLSGVQSNALTGNIDDSKE